MSLPTALPKAGYLFFIKMPSGIPAHSLMAGFAHGWSLGSLHVTPPAFSGASKHRHLYPPAPGSLLSSRACAPQPTSPLPMERRGTPHVSPAQQQYSVSMNEGSPICSCKPEAQESSSSPQQSCQFCLPRVSQVRQFPRPAAPATSTLDAIIFRFVYFNSLLTCFFIFTLTP